MEIRVSSYHKQYTDYFTVDRVTEEVLTGSVDEILQQELGRIDADDLKDENTSLSLVEYDLTDLTTITPIETSTSFEWDVDGHTQIAADGSITVPPNDETVEGTITLIARRQNAFDTKVFDITTINPVLLDQSALEIGLGDNPDLDNVTTDLTFPSEGTYGSTITWDASAHSQITDGGVVNSVPQTEVADSWNVVGTKANPYTSIGKGDVDVDSTGTPYIIIDYIDIGIHKWNGTSWDQLGGTIDKNLGEAYIRCDSSNNVYAILRSDVVYIYKYINSSWSLMFSSPTDYWANFSYVMDNNDNIWMSVQNSSTNVGRVYEYDTETEQATIQREVANEWGVMGINESNNDMWYLYYDFDTTQWNIAKWDGSSTFVDTYMDIPYISESWSLIHLIVIDDLPIIVANQGTYLLKVVYYTDDQWNSIASISMNSSRFDVSVYESEMFIAYAKSADNKVYVDKWTRSTLETYLTNPVSPDEASFPKLANNGSFPTLLYEDKSVSPFVNGVQNVSTTLEDASITANIIATISKSNVANDATKTFEVTVTS